MTNIFDTPPQHVNEQGVKFWLDVDLTRYGREKGLGRVQVLFIETPDKKQTRLITENGQPVFEHTGLENVAVHLDIMALAK